ncbi:MAG TPA: hypothetical protein VG388_01170 [Solirubrobacteraceae bacterium]|nr:hypothetical protein [Solirubrobacteraceae bacterium]
MAHAVRGALLQRTVSGISTVTGLKQDAQAWNTFLLLTQADQRQFQDDVGDVSRDVPLADYIAKARISGEPVLRAWYGANIGAIATGAVGRIDVGGQNPAKYGGYNKLLRFRWFGVVGPVGPRGSGAKVQIAVLGLNLHRGPRYPGLGHAWCKIGDELVFEFAHDVITTNKATIVASLEGHAAASADADVSTKANNANCVPPVPVGTHT